VPGVRRLSTRLPGLALLEPRVFADDRGFFLESFREEELAGQGIVHDWVQDNHSRSVRGVVRGLHFSVGQGQAKLVRCVRGEIFDVAVDLRPGSPTFGRWEGVTLSDRNHLQLYIPVGFAHGFCVISEVADVAYKCSAYYDAELERELAFDDPTVGVRWPVARPLVSDRDRAAPRLEEIGELPVAFDAARSTA
jgi:dTDP-4-dehydrorhamnose 3,5-epimerase